MEHLYVIGGQQRTPRPLRAGNQNWDGYHKGLIVQVNVETGTAETCLEYISPPSVCASVMPAISFQSGAIEDGKLYVCTQTEILIYTLPTFKRLGYVSLACFNDVHHVRPTPDGHLLVANAGLEQVLEITCSGEIRRVWNVLGEDPWQRFSRDIDYRKIASTKPHHAHPNYVFYVDDDPWVTRFHQGDAICLTDPKKRIAISDRRIHDGLVYNGHIYFTTVDGSIVVANPRTLRVDDVIDLNSMHPEGMLSGWCRSLFLDEHRMWVGFSRIRPTKVRENVSWIVHGFRRGMPTHVAGYDLRRRTCIAEINVEPAGLSAIYGIFPARN